MARLRRLVSDIQTYVCVRPYQSSVSPPKVRRHPGWMAPSTRVSWGQLADSA